VASSPLDACSSPLLQERGPLSHLQGFSAPAQRYVVANLVELGSLGLPVASAETYVNKLAPLARLLQEEESSAGAPEARLCTNDRSSIEDAMIATLSGHCNTLSGHSDTSPFQCNRHGRVDASNFLTAPQCSAAAANGDSLYSLQLFVQTAEMRLACAASSERHLLACPASRPEQATEGLPPLSLNTAAGPPFGLGTSAELHP
jgi:hypothetical protein